MKAASTHAGINGCPGRGCHIAATWFQGWYFNLLSQALILHGINSYSILCKPSICHFKMAEIIKAPTEGYI